MYAIQPQPQRTYRTESEAEGGIHEWTRFHGFNVSRKIRYLGDYGEVKSVLFACDRAGKPQNNHKLTEEERKRPMRASKKMGCPMRIKISICDMEWSIEYTRDGSTKHNHPPSEDIRIHARYRQRAAMSDMPLFQPTTLSFIQTQSSAGVATAQVHAAILMSSPYSLVVPKDISNARSLARRHLLSTQIAMEALFGLLAYHGFFYKFEVHPATQHLRYLFWAHPQTTARYREWSDVLIVDCTYKTNKYRMPLLSMVVVTGMNTVVPVAQCWLPGEAEPDYVWAFKALCEMQVNSSISTTPIIITDRDQACMNAVESVFPAVPTMVCRWHMNKNVLAKARKVLGQERVKSPGPFDAKYRNSAATDAFMAKFYETVNSRTRLIFTVNCAALRAMNVTVANYLARHWWKYKEKIVHCRTDTYCHFGYEDTSIVEGTHVKMKRWLHNSQGDLLTVFQHSMPWWITTIDVLSLRIQYNATKAPYVLQSDCYSAVVRIIAIYALVQIEKLLTQARETVAKSQPRSDCLGSFRLIHGRPCVHELTTLILSRGSLKLLPKHFDLHWWVRPSDLFLCRRVLEPSITQQRNRVGTERVRHAANFGLYSARREPTYSERVDWNHLPLHHDFQHMTSQPFPVSLTYSQDSLNMNKLTRMKETHTSMLRFHLGRGGTLATVLRRY